MKLGKSDVGNLVGISVMVVIFIFGLLNGIKGIDYATVNTKTYELLRDANNCDIDLGNSEDKERTVLNEAQLEGFNDAVEKWNLVCSLKGSK